MIKLQFFYIGKNVRDKQFVCVQIELFCLITTVAFDIRFIFHSYFTHPDQVRLG